jgi:hypothetical protein
MVAMMARRTDTTGLRGVEVWDQLGAGTETTIVHGEGERSKHP